MKWYARYRDKIFERKRRRRRKRRKRGKRISREAALWRCIWISTQSNLERLRGHFYEIRISLNNTRELRVEMSRHWLHHPLCSLFSARSVKRAISLCERNGKRNITDRRCNLTQASGNDKVATKERSLMTSAWNSDSPSFSLSLSFSLPPYPLPPYRSRMPRLKDGRPESPVHLLFLAGSLINRQSQAYSTSNTLIFCRYSRKKTNNNSRIAEINNTIRLSSASRGNRYLLD